MLYPEFAYSTKMQLILAFMTFTESFCSMYMLSNMILIVFGVSAGRKQKILFAFITGTLLQNVFIYGIYFLGGMISFSNLTYLLITTPNPIVAIIYYYAAQKIFNLSPVRSISLISYIFLYWITAKTLSRLSYSLFFLQNEIRYNYMKDALNQIVYVIIFFVVYKLAQYILKINYTSVRLSENMFFDKKKELVIFFLKVLFIYAVRIILPIIIPQLVVAYTMVLLILIFLIVISICFDIIAYNKQTISNHEMHISTLFKGMEELRGIKHDFNNILHTYSGYIELKEYKRLELYHASLVSATSHANNIMELAQKMPENPALITLFINKLEYSEKMNVKLLLSLKCDVANMFIDNMDISRVLSCVLDNAIEAASDSKQHKVYVTIESKTPASKLIIITNGTDIPIDIYAMSQDGVTNKAGHVGIGLTIVRNILSKYGNCSYQMKYFDHEISTYIELKEFK